MRGRKPISIENHRQRGTYRPREHDLRASLPPPAGVPIKPAGISGDADLFWDCFVAALIERGDVGLIDSPQLQALCDMWAAYRRTNAAADKDIQDHSMREAALKYWAAFNKLAASFGMTPADRRGVQMHAPKKESELSKFARKRA